MKLSKKRENRRIFRDISPKLNRFSGIYPVSSVLQFFFPALCPICHQSQTWGTLGICQSCAAELDLILHSQEKQENCLRCGLPRTDLDQGNGFDQGCYQCSKRNIYYDSFHYFFYHRPILKQAIHDLKFRKNRYVVKMLSPSFWKSAVARFQWDVDFFTTIPVSKKSAAMRGGNQTEFLFAGLEHFFPKESILEKQEGRHLRTYGRVSRFFTVSEAYRIQEGKNIVGKRILLVDDFSTSGATINYCSWLLKEKQASHVIALVFMQH